MKKLALTLCVAGMALGLAACETGRTYDSGSSYATDRTAGDVDGGAVAQQERVFRAAQTK